MLSRFAVFCALLFAVPCFAQTSSTAVPAPALRIFNDSALDLTFGYPGEFTPVSTDATKTQSTSKSGDQVQCVRSILTAGSETKLGSSAFVISVIDGTCPGVLKQAEQPGSFTREQILRQLKGYGTPTLTQDPFRYSIGGRQAAVTLASAQRDDAAPTRHKVTTYAAKACFLSDIRPKASGKQSAAAAGEVICVDFTTQDHDLLTRILAFTVKFSDQTTHPVVPGNAVR